MICHLALPCPCPALSPGTGSSLLAPATGPRGTGSQSRGDGAHTGETPLGMLLRRLVGRGRTLAVERGYWEVFGVRVRTGPSLGCVTGQVHRVPGQVHRVPRFHWGGKWGDALSGGAWRAALSSWGQRSPALSCVWSTVGAGLWVGGAGTEPCLRSPSVPHNQDPMPAGQVPPGVKQQE